MSDPKRAESPAPAKSGAESPTTARPLEMDDDDIQDTSLSGHEQTANAPATQATTSSPPAPEVAPAKPPRPLTAQQEAEKTLKEAFPGIDAAVIRAVLIASGGKIEPAFNALLGMSDPEHAVEPEEAAPPQQPPRPARGGAPMSQLEADELYARQLAQHYDSAQQQNRSRSAGQGSRHPQNGQHIRPRRESDEDYNFIDDELPKIKEDLLKGFQETQTKVNSWITNLKKRIDGDTQDEIHAQQARQAQGSYQKQQGQRRSGDGRRSNDAGRYDADPQVLSDDFAGIQLSDDTNNQRRASRPLANPDLFKPQPARPRSNDGRKVSFQEQPTQIPRQDSDLYNATPATKESGKPSKWQPLSSVEPNPTTEDNDPFSLGDSDDEREAKAGGKEAAKDDEAVKKAENTSDAAGSASASKPAGEK